MPILSPSDRVLGGYPFRIFAGFSFLIAMGAAGMNAYQGSLATRIEQAALSSPLFWGEDDAQGSAADLFTLISPKKPLYALSTYDRGLYANIFAAQDAGDWLRANALVKRLHDKSLLGHVYYGRYIMSKNYKASYAELRQWMINYGDHPDAYKVYQLAQKRRNNDPASLPTPQIAKKLFGSLEFAWLNKDIRTGKEHKPAKRNEGDVRRLTADIKNALSNDRVTSAYDLLGKSPASKMLSNAEYDSLLGNIAAGYFFNGKYDTSYAVANQAASRSHLSVPYAHWIAGLSAWKRRDYRVSADHFKSVMSSHSRNAWMLSASAFWASRSYEKLGDMNTSNDWLREAASYPRTFYGLVAQQKLGSESNFSWDKPQLSPNLIDTLRQTNGGKRALALVDLGRNDLAAREFEQLNPNGNKRIEKALVAAAHHFNIPSLSLRLGNAVNDNDGKLYDVALYPIVPWKGDTSTGVNSALVNALIRQESKFSAQAQNKRTGAKGLMQLMPRTAQFVSDKSYSAQDLHKPEVNIVLGQRYIKHLLSLNQVKGNLFYLAAAYNAGPGNLARWQKDIDDQDDPFVFMESIPVAETRAFVAQVMTNYWIYNQRLKQQDATLDNLSQGNWPIYDVKPSLRVASY